MSNMQPRPHKKTKVLKFPRTMVLQPKKNEYKEIYDFIKANLNENGEFPYTSIEKCIIEPLGVTASNEGNFKTAYRALITGGLAEVLDKGSVTKQRIILKEWDSIG